MSQISHHTVIATEKCHPPRIVHQKMSACYEAEQKETGGEYRDVDSAKLVDRLRQKPFTRMEFSQIDSLFTDLATLRRHEGVEKLQPLIGAADHPALKLGLELICAEVEQRELFDRVDDYLNEELRQIELRHRMVLAGIRTVWDLKNPKEVSVIIHKIAAE